MDSRLLIIGDRTDVTVVTMSVDQVDLSENRIPLPDEIALSVATRRQDYVAGRYCAERALQIHTGNGHIVQRSSNGLPVWPNGVVGSIAHSAGVACAGVAYCADNILGLGIDVEGVIPDQQRKSLLEICASPLERAKYSTALEATLLFSLKESFFKAFYHRIGSVIEFTDVEVLSLNFDSATAELRVIDGLAQRIGCSRIGGLFALEGNVVYTLCVSSTLRSQ